jgi:hypothetical protein
LNFGCLFVVTITLNFEKVKEFLFYIHSLNYSMFPTYTPTVQLQQESVDQLNIQLHQQRTPTVHLYKEQLELFQHPINFNKENPTQRQPNSTTVNI